MKEKLMYAAPEAEMVKIQMEASILNYSGGEGGANASAMTGDTTTFGDSWDAQ